MRGSNFVCGCLTERLATTVGRDGAMAIRGNVIDAVRRETLAFPTRAALVSLHLHMRGMSQCALRGHASLGHQWGHRPVAYIVDTLRRQGFMIASGLMGEGTVNSSEVFAGARQRQNIGNVAVTHCTVYRLDFHILQCEHNTTGKGSLLDCPSCLPGNPIGQRTESNTTKRNETVIIYYNNNNNTKYLICHEQL